MGGQESTLNDNAEGVPEVLEAKARRMRELEKSVKAKLLNPDNLSAIYHKTSTEVGGSNVLTADGFAEALRLLEGAGLSNLHATPLAVRLFHIFDEDKDSLLTEAEFMAGIHLLLEGTLEQKLDMTFRAYDTDASGTISPDEMAEVLLSSLQTTLGLYGVQTGDAVQWHANLTQTVRDVVRDAFAAFSKETEGRLTRQEFSEWAATSHVTRDVFNQLGLKNPEHGAVEGDDVTSPPAGAQPLLKNVTASVTFGQGLWDGIEKVEAQTEAGAKMRRHMQKFFKDFSKANIEYGKTMTKICDKAWGQTIGESHPSYRTSLSAWRACIMSTSVLAAETQRMGNEVNDQIVTSLDIQASAAEARLKDALEQCQRYRSELKRATERVNKGRIAMDKSARDAAAAPAAKAAQSAAKADENEKEYRTALSTFNTVRKAHHCDRMPLVLDDMQAIERQRLEDLQTCLNSYVGLLSQREPVARQMRSSIALSAFYLDPTADLNSFVETHVTGAIPPDDVEYEGPDLEGTSTPVQVEAGGGIATNTAKGGGVFNLKDKFKLKFGGGGSGGGGGGSGSDGGGSGGSSSQTSAASKLRPSLAGASSKYFGATLASQATPENGYSPPVFKWLLDTLQSMDGNKTEGLFRISAQLYALQALRASLEGVGLDETVAKQEELVPSVHVAAATLKAWLRELPEPLLPVEHYDAYMQAADADDRLAAFGLVKDLAPANRTVLFALLSFLRQLVSPENRVVTKMGVDNLAIVFAPCLLRGPSNDPAVMMLAATKEMNLVKLLLHPDHDYSDDACTQ